MVSDNTALVRFYDAQGVGQPHKPSLYLLLENVAEPFAVMQYSSTFAKNEIPTATCVLGTGDSLFNNHLVAVPEELAENLDGAVMLKATVWLQFGPNSQWEPGGREFGQNTECIFEGYYAGLSYSRVGPQIQMSINLVHRLVDLTFGSLMTGWQHPSNPAVFLQPAVAPILGGTGADCQTANAGGEGSWSSANFLKDAVSDLGPTDFGDALIQTLLCLTAQDVFKMNCADQDLPRQPNTDAAEVLKSIVSKTGGLRPPLNTDAMLNTIGYYMGAIIDDSQGLTYWDYLIGKVCPDFVMSVIPLPSTQSSPDNAFAYITADTPGLNRADKVLHLDDYTNFSLKARMWKPLYAVGVMSDGDNLSGAEMPNNKQKPIGGGLCLGGVFPNPNDLDGQLGQFLIIRQPEWLKYLNLTTEAQKDFGNTGQAAHDAIEADSHFAAPAREPADLNTDRNNILDMYAKMYYVHNAINGRGGTFDSKFRFDICPGTIVKLDKGKGAFQFFNASNKYKELPGSVYAQISRVTHNVNSEAPMAKTSFDCIHLRTEKENDKGQPEGRYSVAEHVFLDQTFGGAPLIQNWRS